ncbi:MAG: hypothetical protein QOF25_4486, partial [Mycobacterium sp.]|nr:hypothetical protein [Mycobacterium sp.]
MAVRDETVVWLGTDDMGRLEFPDADVVDLDDGFVAPAFVDSHVHLTATGLSTVGLDLRAAASLEDLLRLVTDYAHRHPDAPIWAHGWDETDWPRSVPPTTQEVDAILGGRPAYLARVDVHSAVASTGLRQLVPDLATATGYSAQLALTADAHHLAR